MPRNPIGRPRKYEHIILALEDESYYSPASMVLLAEERGMLDTDATDHEARRQEKLRIRIALGRFSNNREFPDEGDGQVKIKGQRSVPGWKGWRWKAALSE